MCSSLLVFQYRFFYFLQSQQRVGTFFLCCFRNLDNLQCWRIIGIVIGMKDAIFTPIINKTITTNAIRIYRLAI